MTASILPAQPEAAPETADERVLFALKTKGAMTAQRLAHHLAISPVAARKQLARLEDAALVQFQEEARGPGRPERVWRLTAKGHGRFPDSHSDLTLELIGSIRRLFGEEGLDRLIGQREQIMQHSYESALETQDDLKDRVAALARIRAREGYMAEVEALEDGAFLLIENHCPICAAATACQGFCRSELSVFRTVLGPQTRVERTDHILAGARRCAYRIEARSDD
ncbi:transcriptional regulator [Nitratireductor aquimarinus]|uniref:helix-turn-helix transcriptional regulator n=1 Tax=Nitratireductor TaxID=245876 RepID=UPI0019D33A55|nr:MULTISPECIES: metalloregulator ArsR/SmtB family transcription factor [Nitratireductor]MBN7775264.1 transcriptional regulator [Nitratireductor pacificus]MBN7781278.1 transcriptional regulator [Nitratireductor pacificus]MBN7790084.1 transcriptional regulator [Nitratireductor aquimarinus]MBY6097651.1 transcriptional regulator [Nitratireductor aquimarinus]